jgi:hypothetical protein
MKQTHIFLILILLLAACTSTTTEPAASEAPLPANDAAAPEPALNEQTAKPQFIMFTASW